jgi:hypothetical protein
MSGAHVSDIESLRTLRAGLIVFADEVRQALNEVDALAAKAAQTISLEMIPHWTTQVRLGHDVWHLAKGDLMRMQTSFTSDHPTCVEQRGKIQKAKAAYEHAQQTLAQLKTLAIELERRVTIYKGQTQACQDLVHRQMPLASATLERYVRVLEEYRQIGLPVQALETLEVLGKDDGAGASDDDDGASAKLGGDQ